MNQKGFGDQVHFLEFPSTCLYPTLSGTFDSF